MNASRYPNTQSKNKKIISANPDLKLIRKEEKPKENLLDKYFLVKATEEVRQMYEDHLIISN